ncbi:MULTISPECIES: DUF4255 domain-containing protein [unclassified Streptomyces]|uniref:DUF4255 domain-containing protein n=1 Tax=unclassified Streptomyces TaxID=2593676 RepID=UPI0038075A5B
MIHEVDEGLRLLLAEAGLEDAGVDLVFDAPTRDWSARRNAPTVSVFLYGIREDAARRRSGTAEEYDTDGLVVAWRTPPRWFELTYLVTAWTNRPQDEHRLLSQVLRRLIAQEMLPKRVLTGSLAELGLAVPLFAAGGPDGPSAHDVWSALGGELKASISLTVIAPLSGETTPAGPPVTEGLIVKSVASSTIADGDVPGRQLRYEGIRDPGPDGFSSPRERRPTPARRRRGGRQE